MIAEAERLLTYFTHIQMSCGRIEEYMEGVSREAFCRGGMAADAVILQLAAIGETSGKIKGYHSRIFKEVPGLRPLLSQAKELRNQLVHDYFNTDLEAVWMAIETVLPLLQQQVRAALKELENQTRDGSR